MVIVDTSIWISLYRKRNAEIGQMIWMLTARNEAAVIGQIWVEFLGGFRDRPTRTAYAEKFRAYPFIETTRAAYDLAAELLAAHPRLGAGDAIIAPTSKSPSVARITRLFSLASLDTAAGAYETVTGWPRFCYESVHEMDTRWTQC